jgi:hypothetical protein
MTLASQRPFFLLTPRNLAQYTQRERLQLHMNHALDGLYGVHSLGITHGVRCTNTPTHSLRCSNSRTHQSTANLHAITLVRCKWQLLQLHATVLHADEVTNPVAGLWVAACLQAGTKDVAGGCAPLPIGLYRKRPHCKSRHCHSQSPAALVHGLDPQRALQLLSSEPRQLLLQASNLVLVLQHRSSTTNMHASAQHRSRWGKLSKLMPVLQDGPDE